MDALQIDIHAEGSDAPASFFLIHPARSARVAGLILFGELAAYVARNPAPAYFLTWSTGAGAGGFDFAGDLSRAIERCADELSGPGALSSPPAFGDPAEEDAARFWVNTLEQARIDRAAGLTAFDL
jgi:hypothetical protein